MNNHVLIEPKPRQGFFQTEDQKYQEIGVVVEPYVFADTTYLKPGDVVYFDAWLAKKYPKSSDPKDFYWLVKWDDITAVEYAEPQ